MSMLKLVTAALAYKYPRLRSWYLRICKPSNLEYAAYLKKHGGFYAMGELNSITVGATFTDPAYVRIGNNCGISACTLLGHDGSIRILNNAYGKKLDSGGKIDIRDNSFIGHGAIIMPRVTIGPNAIVAAGAVVTGDVAPGTVGRQPGPLYLHHGGHGGAHGDPLQCLSLARHHPEPRGCF